MPKLEPDPLEFERLSAAAHHSERVRGRRLAKRSGLSEAAALRLTLEQVAGPIGLAPLLEQRRQLREAELARLAARQLARAQRWHVKTAARQAPAHAWQAWFDGSAHPNPGKMGIGAVLTGPHGQRLDISQPAGMGNSSEAEYAALIALLEAAVQRRVADLLVCGDSQVVINDVLGHVGGSAAAGAKGLERQRQAVAALLAQLGKVTLQWIPRHKNGAADRLSQQAVAAWHGAASEGLTAP